MKTLPVRDPHPAAGLDAPAPGVSRALVALVVTIALLAAVTAAIGAFGRGDGSTATATSVRGETYRYATTGVYKFSGQRVVAEGVGWDYVTLLFAVPALLVTVPGLSRGSLRARLLALGLLGYFFYQYLMYAVFWAFCPLFVNFIALYSLSAAAIVWLVSGVDVPTLSERIDEVRFPRKTLAIVCAVMALQLVAMWSVRIAAALRGDVTAAGFEGMPTLSVQAMDLGMIVPLALATAALVWRRRPWGYLLGAVFSVKGVTMAGAICAMLISAALVEGRLEVGSFALFGVATLLFGLLAYKTLGSVLPSRDAGVSGRGTALEAGAVQPK